MADTEKSADLVNSGDINDNFNTIKTLLNSIRAQGILNTSDVDKLLTGINTKLEKLNNEEDIDAIKIFLSDLKQNFEERHSTLISKFGAIESLFSNLLKNSNELPKSAQLKEWIDIVATNLSVFSREVVSQKESLTDIALKIDSMRSDDSNKKEIIKNIAILKPDLERLNNGFDSIVISLNDNFKTIVKTISTIDKTEHLDKFSESLSNIEMSSNTVLSALQMLDKKTEQVDNELKNLVTKDDLKSASLKLDEVREQSKAVSDSVNDLAEKYVRVENIADKIDASVNIVAGLKSALTENDDKNTKLVLDDISALTDEVKNISPDVKIEEIKTQLDSYDFNKNFQDVLGAASTVEAGIKEHINTTSGKQSTLNEANVTRVLNGIAESADSLNNQFAKSQSEISVLCEKNFNTVYENIENLKNIVSQIDDNGITANNAIFSNITDRLSSFENMLKISLETQERSMSDSSAKLVDRIEDIKNLSGVLDYKMDSSVVEVGNVKREFENLKASIDSVLALDFVNVVKDLRADLYASKQDMFNSFETSKDDLSDKLAKDLYSKYELLISKLDAVEDEFKKTQITSLSEFKPILDNISSSLVDVLSYVSESKGDSSEFFESKLNEISSTVKETNISYVESVRDIVDVIRVQVENNLKSAAEDYTVSSKDLKTSFESAVNDIKTSLEKSDAGNKDNYNEIKETALKNAASINEGINNSVKEIKESVTSSEEEIKKDIKYSYSKLLEIQDSYNEIKELLDASQLNSTNKLEGVLATAVGLRGDFDDKLSTLKLSLLDKITEFKQEFASDNENKTGEIKVAVEKLNNLNSDEIKSVLTELKEQINEFSTSSADLRTSALAKILDNFVGLKEFATTLNEKYSIDLTQKVNELIEDFGSVKAILNKVDENVDSDMTRQLSIIESNFETLVSQITILFEKADNNLSEKINDEFADISEKMQEIVTEKLEGYKARIETTFDELKKKADTQSDYLQDRIANLNIVLKSIWEEQGKENIKEIDRISDRLRDVIQSNINAAEIDYTSLKERISEFVSEVSANNKLLITELKTQLDDITKYLSSVVDIQAQEFTNRQETVENLINANATEMAELKIAIQENKSAVENIDSELDKKLGAIKSLAAELSTNELTSIEAYIETVNSSINDNVNKLEDLKIAIKTSQSAIEDTVHSSIGNNINELEDLKIAIKTSQSAIEDAVHSSVNNNVNGLEELKVAIQESKTAIDNIDSELDKKLGAMKLLATELSTNELANIEAYIETLKEQIELQAQIIRTGKDAVSEVLKNELKTISGEMEKETDAVIAELTDQFSSLRDSQQDDVVRLTSRIEEVVASKLYENIDELKAYFDVKSSDNALALKLDNLGGDISKTLENMSGNISKLLDGGAFNNAMSDFRLANEIMVNASIDRINEKIEAFINDNIKTIAGVLSEDTKKVEEKLSLFDKKFTDTVVDKYEEIKLISNGYNSSLSNIQNYINDLAADFKGTEAALSEKIDDLSCTIKDSAEITSKEIAKLSDAFNSLKSQISSKSFDEAFQSSINKQIAGIEGLINEQFGYIEDINELCSTTLPDITEISTLVKGSITESVKALAEKINSQDIEGTLLSELKQLKTEVITQIINVFNQISFASEQEEILDFIQDKHDELIDVLSNIVSTSDKIDIIKSDISHINEKINSIISSEGDIDYIYSLQDLESDIANLRLALNEMKEYAEGLEFSELVDSTNNIYKLVEAIKSDLPTREDYKAMSDDIESISTRTNKLILSSDESYNMLKDNLQEFKLVISDLDERTRNFAKESGMDRVNAKLNTLNEMMQNGSKTNQVFNQVFEYLAEWVDEAGLQINTIADKAASLDDIAQIKDILIDLKKDAEEDNTDEEVAEAIGLIFDKQNKRMTSMETKLDKLIVNTTVSKNKSEISAFEKTLNKFLVAMDEKFTAQQDKINSLESTLENVLSMLDEKDTAQLTKKVGGMDRQIAKLNKSIEKIASHVVEK